MAMSAEKLTSMVKSSDGKFHRIVLDASAKTLEITVLKADSQPTDFVLLLALNEILAIRNTKVKLANGIPKSVSKNWDAVSQNKTQSNALYLYYAYRRNIYLWRLREAVLIFTSTAEKKQWQAALDTAIKELTQRAKFLQIFVNPYGGKGKARQVYKKFVEPFLDLVGVERRVMETERANHAYDVVRGMSADEWRTIEGVISVGGDGLFNEVLSATIIRSQEENGKNIEDPSVEKLVTPPLRFGIIGAGSANSIVSSVHGVDDWATASIHVVIGSKCSVDVCTVHEENRLLRISANAISYGWLGDVLHDSEYYRCLGPIRYQWSALRTSIRHPTYYGRVSFALSDAQSQTTPVKLPKCTTPCGVCDGTESEPNYPFHVQTDFTHVICCVIPCVSPFTPYGLAPYAGVGDGSMDLALVPKVSRCENLQIMRKVSMYGGKGLIRLMQNNLYVFRVKRWKYTPPALLEKSAPLSLANDKEKAAHSNDASAGASVSRVDYDESEHSGAWNLDGEILPQPANKSLHFRLHTRLIDYFGRELDLDDPRYQRCLCRIKGPKRHSKIVVIG